MDIQQNHLERVKEFRETVEICRSSVSDIMSSARRRMVWFTAIAGYIVLNARPVWDSIACYNFKGIWLATLIAPWIVTAILAIWTHLQIDITIKMDNIAYARKLGALNNHIWRASVLSEEFKNEEQFTKLYEEFLDIINDAEKDLEKDKKAVENAAKNNKCLERWTCFFLFFSFFWLLSGPFLIKLLAIG